MIRRGISSAKALGPWWPDHSMVRLRSDPCPRGPGKRKRANPRLFASPTPSEFCVLSVRRYQAGAASSSDRLVRVMGGIFGVNAAVQGLSTSNTTCFVEAQQFDLGRRGPDPLRRLGAFLTLPLGRASSSSSIALWRGVDSPGLRPAAF